MNNSEPLDPAQAEPLPPADAAQLSAPEVQAYLQSVVDTVREPFLVLTADLRVVSANRAFYQTFRVSPKETEAKLVYELGDGQWDIPALRGLLHEVLQADDPFEDFPVEHDFPGIGHKVMRLNAHKLYRPGNHTAMILLAIEDITERLRASAELQTTGEQLRLLIDSARDYAIVSLDTQGRIVFWNEGAERILGWTEAEAIGQLVHIFFTPEDRVEGIPEKEMGKSVATDRADDTRWHLRKDGSRFFADGVMTSQRDEAGNLRGFGKVFRNVTERKQTEELLARAYEREHRIAESLQRSLLLVPPEDQFPNLSIATLYEPALDEASIGGDFFDLFALNDGKVALVVGDASGKGLAAAIRTSEIKFALRAFLREYDNTGRCLARLNGHICDAQRLDHQEVTGFTVLSLAVLDPASGNLELSVAGAEPPLVLRRTGNAEPADARANGFPLGVEPQAEYSQATLHLASGDTLLMVTDGITEARASKASGGAFFGYERMMALAQQASSRRSLREIGQTIVDEARAFAEGTLRDDVCLLLAQRQ